MINHLEGQVLKRLICETKLSFTWIVITALIALGSSTCFGQEDFSEFRDQGTRPSLNLTPSDKSWVFFDLPLGKYRFDTSVQLEEISENRVLSVENDIGLEQKALSLQFSIRW